MTSFVGLDTVAPAHFLDLGDLTLSKAARVCVCARARARVCVCMCVCVCVRVCV